MKKIALFLLILVLAIAGFFCMDRPNVAQKAMGAAVKMESAAHALSFSEDTLSVSSSSPKQIKPATESAETGEVEQDCHSDDIPLTYKEQDLLLAACEEFDVPYALALGLIEKESRFQNISGDNGASAGYMQIQQKWHWVRMERLGVMDLMEPYGNFRVGCDLLSELHGKYGNWDLALTVYNMGHDPGYITGYAKDVMQNYAHWQKLLQIYD